MKSQRAERFGKNNIKGKLNSPLITWISTSTIICHPPRPFWSSLSSKRPFRIDLDKTISHEIIYLSLSPCCYLERHAPICRRCMHGENYWRCNHSTFYISSIWLTLLPAKCAETSVCCSGYCIPEGRTPEGELGDTRFKNAGTCGTENGSRCRLPGGDYILIFFFIFQKGGNEMETKVNHR